MYEHRHKDGEWLAVIFVFWAMIILVWKMIQGIKYYWRNKP